MIPMEHLIRLELIRLEHLIRDIKGIFHAKMDIIKNRNCMDLTEVEDIKKRWQEYTEDLYKKRPEWYKAMPKNAQTTAQLHSSHTLPK